MFKVSETSSQAFAIFNFSFNWFDKTIWQTAGIDTTGTDFFNHDKGIRDCTNVLGAMQTPGTFRIHKNDISEQGILIPIVCLSEFRHCGYCTGYKVLLIMEITKFGINPK